MKKILLSLLLVGGLLSSCDMNDRPIGSLPDDEAIENASDCFRYRNGIYNNLRALSTGAYIYYTEIQMDQFLGTTLNGNRIGNLSNGVILSSDDDIATIWGGLYGAIGSVNYFLPRAQAILDAEPATEDEALSKADRTDINRYLGEAYFGRAYFYYWLLDHYCPAYTPANADQLLGLPLVSDYDPTADKATYPSRSSLRDTYAFINADLDKAYTLLKAFEQSDAEDANSGLRQNAPYLSSYVVRALQARVALLQGDNTHAVQYAKEVISSGIWSLSNRYTLINRTNTYNDIWTNDQGTELIFRPVSSAGELGISSTGSGWISTNQYSADYIPTEAVISNLYPEGDTRKSCFLSSRDLLGDGVYVKNVQCFNKYPGNPELIQSNPNLMNMAKPFRLSEMYLIVAEASQLAGNEKDANEYLNAIRNKRISSWKTTDYTGTELRDQIRLERDRELIGEGFRMSDLRRWGLGFSRSGSYPSNPSVENIIVRAGTTVQYQPNDYRYTWPIPSSEIQVNPQLTGQQNPGYN